MRGHYKALVIYLHKTKADRGYDCSVKLLKIKYQQGEKGQYTQEKKRGLELSIKFLTLRKVRF